MASNEPDTGFWVGLFGTIVTAIGFLYTWFREGREHKWTRDAAKEAAREAAEAKKKVEALRKDMKKAP